MTQLKTAKIPMYQDIFDALGKLGLKRDEAKVYLACLRNRGGLFVHEITMQTKVKRSTIDLIIRRLLSRNFLTSFRDGQRYKYMAESPERILFDYQRELDDFRSLLPMLMSLGGNQDQTRVKFYEGAKGIKAIYDDMLVTMKNVPEKERLFYCLSSGRDIERILPRFPQQFIEQRVRARISVLMIAVQNEPNQTWPSSRADLRVTKMFDGKKFPFTIEICWYGDKIMIISAYKPIGGIVIQNAAITNSLRSVFHFMWESLGDPQPDMDDKYVDRTRKRKR